MPVEYVSTQSLHFLHTSHGELQLVFPGSDLQSTHTNYFVNLLYMRFINHVRRINLAWRKLVSCLDPALSRGKGSGDYWTVSWLCWLGSIDFERTLIICLHNVRPISLVYAHASMTWHYFIGLSKIKTLLAVRWHCPRSVDNEISWNLSCEILSATGAYLRVLSHCQ